MSTLQKAMDEEGAVLSDKLIISASQLDTFTLCPRKWWFQRVLRLKEVQKGYFTFGTVLHGCIERWMAGDKQGRVPYSDDPSGFCQTGILVGQIFGEPVDVFPPGWETIEEKGTKVSVTPNEARLIRRLFTEAVERGIIAKDEGITIEREIRLPVLDGVELFGYIDLHKQVSEGANYSESKRGGTFAIGVPEIHDHKSFGESSTRYLKQPGPRDGGGNLIPIDQPYAPGDGTSPNSIGHDQQVLTYAASTSILDGYEGPVLVRHNQFPKFDDPKGVRKVEAIVSSKRIKAHWAWVQETAKRMVLVHKIKKWTDTPGPTTTDACSKYGGCPFAGICGKRETTEVYSKRVERLTASQAKNTRPNLTLSPRKRKVKNAMATEKSNIFQRAQQQAAARKGTTAGTATATPQQNAKAVAAKGPKATAINSPSPASVAQQVSNPAPWGDPKCPVSTCRGLGLNSKGRPCPICDKTAPKRGVPTSSMYTLTLDEDGTVTAVANDDAEVEALGGDAAWAGEVPKAGATPAVTAAAQTDVTEQAVDLAPAAISAPVKRGPGRPRKNAQAAPQPEPPAEVVQEAPEAESAAAEAAPAKDKGGRPRVGFTLMIAAVQLKGPTRTLVTIQELLETVGAELAADMGAESYWALDGSKRRERIRQAGEKIAEGLGKMTVVVPGGTNDFDVIALVNALIPHADMVIEGLR